MTRQQIAILGFGGIIILIIGLLLVFGRKQAPPPPPPVTAINFWGFKSDESAWRDVIARYQAARTNIVVNYKAVDESNYETELIDALAAGAGPDVFMFHYDWLPKHKNKIIPAPADLITRERVAEIFPRAVSEDFVSANQVYALPAAMNTLALVYNRDYFDLKGVATIPRTWDDVKNLVPRLRELSGGKIAKSAIALGSSDKNIKNASDIFTLMSLQNKVNFGARTAETAGFAASGGEATLRYYIDFSNPASRNFAFFEGTQQNSLDSFAEGKTAMIFAYPHDLEYIRSKNNFINIRVVAMPQFNASEPVNLTDYWGLAVSNRTSSPSIAWDFVSFATMNEEAVRVYIKGSGNQPALRSLIGAFSDDPILGVFAPQALNAVSFPKTNKEGFRRVVNNMIESALRNRSSVGQVAANAEAEFANFPR